MNHPAVEQHAIVAKAIRSLTPWQRGAFALSCAVRLEPAYARFARRTDPERENRFSMLIDYLYRHLVEDRSGRADITGRLQEVMALIPFEEDPTWDEATHPYAEDAAAALAYAYRCVMTGAPEEAIWAGRRTYEAAQYLVDSGADISPALTLAEIDRQKQDVSVLVDAGTEGLDREAVLADLLDRSRKAPTLPMK